VLAARFRSWRPAGSTGVVGRGIYGLVGAISLEQNDEWPVDRARYITWETIAIVRDVDLPALTDRHHRLNCRTA
jgi:hypothetical protein